jgi:hypothetical protein
MEEEKEKVLRTILTVKVQAYKTYSNQQANSRYFNKSSTLKRVMHHNVKQIVKFRQSITQCGVSSPVILNVANHKVVISSFSYPDH